MVQMFDKLLEYLQQNLYRWLWCVSINEFRWHIKYDPVKLGYNISIFGYLIKTILLQAIRNIYIEFESNFMNFSNNDLRETLNF